MTLRRFASLSLLSASFAFLMAGSTSCVVHSRGGTGPHMHGMRAHHHCHHVTGKCHTHAHTHQGPNAHTHD